MTSLASQYTWSWSIALDARVAIAMKIWKHVAEKNGAMAPWRVTTSVLWVGIVFGSRLLWRISMDPIWVPQVMDIMDIGRKILLRLIPTLEAKMIWRHWCRKRIDTGTLVQKQFFGDVGSMIYDWFGCVCVCVFSCPQNRCIVCFEVVHVLIADLCNLYKYKDVFLFFQSRTSFAVLPPFCNTQHTYAI